MLYRLTVFLQPFFLILMKRKQQMQESNYFFVLCIKVSVRQEAG